MGRHIIHLKSCLFANVRYTYKWEIGRYWRIK